MGKLSPTPPVAAFMLRLKKALAKYCFEPWRARSDSLSPVLGLGCMVGHPPNALGSISGDGRIHICHLTSHPTRGYMLGWRLWGWLKHPEPWGGAGTPGSQTKPWESSATSSRWRKEMGHPPGDRPRQLPWLIHAYMLYPKPQTSRRRGRTTAWHSTGKSQPGTREPAGPPLPVHGCPRGARGGYS